MYKVWVSQRGEFLNSESKTDNFKVKKGRSTEVTEIRAAKFYDLNTDGVRGDPASEPPIADWHIELRRADNNELVGCQLTDGGGEVSFIVTMDGTEYVVSETLVGDYINTTPLTVNVVANQAAVSVEFGNVCIVPRTGLGRTPGFWQACNNGEGRVGCDILLDCDPSWRELLNELCIVEPDGSEVVIPLGGSFEEAFAVLAGWIVGNGAEGNMAYILSRQLAATALNRSCGFLSGGPMWFECPAGERRNLDELLAEANAMLCANPLTPGNDPQVAAARAAQEEIKNCLDALNNNTRPVYGVAQAPCPFEPVACP